MTLKGLFQTCLPIAQIQSGDIPKQQTTTNNQPGVNSLLTKGYRMYTVEKTESKSFETEGEARSFLASQNGLKWSMSTEEKHWMQPPYHSMNNEE